MSLLRDKEIYRPMRGSAGDLHPATPSHHRYDEFPARYSLASCSPALLASASLAVGSMIGITSAGNGLPANSYLSLILVFHPKGAVQLVPPRNPQKGWRGLEKAAPLRARASELRLPAVFADPCLMPGLD